LLENTVNFPPIPISTTKIPTLWTDLKISSSMISENGFFRWKTILGERMYAKKTDNQQTEAAIKCAVLNRFIQLAKPVSVKVA
jgi:hypothetical protein